MSAALKAEWSFYEIQFYALGELKVTKYGYLRFLQTVRIGDSWISNHR